MYMYKVCFRDARTNIPRAIKIVARNRREAVYKATVLRKGFGFFAHTVRSDEEYAMMPIVTL